MMFKKFSKLVVPFMLTALSPLLNSDIAYTKDANYQVQQGLALAERVYNADDPLQARSNLTIEEQNLVDGVTQPGVLEVHSQLIGGTENRDAEKLKAAYTGCWSRYQKYERKALLRNTLYTYWQTTKVCAKKGKVTSVSVIDADGETSTPGWRITHAPTKATKNVGWEGRGLAKYYFVFGAGSWDLQHPTDCIQQRLNGNGVDHLSSKSCDLYATLP